MNYKTVCFVIQNDTLYLDKVLVEINDIPIFFICKNDDGQYYVVLCEDIDEQKYIIVKQSIESIWKMLSQKISMRSLFLQTDTFFEVKAGKVFSDDQIDVLPISKMDAAVLPFEGEIYEPITDDDRSYIDQILSNYLNSDDCFYAIKGIECLCDFFDKNNSFLDNGTSDSIEYSVILPVQKNFSFNAILDAKKINNSTSYKKEDQYIDNVYSYNDVLFNNTSKLCLTKSMTEAA